MCSLLFLTNYSFLKCVPTLRKKQRGISEHCEFISTRRNAQRMLKWWRREHMETQISRKKSRIPNCFMGVIIPYHLLSECLTRQTVTWQSGAWFMLKEKGRKKRHKSQETMYGIFYHKTSMKWGLCTGKLEYHRLRGK